MYSADALASAGITQGGTVTSSGVSYTWPDVAPGQPDNIVADGQTIPVSLPARATTIGLLGSASSAGCSGATGTLTVTYTDGSTQQIPIAFSDWALGGGSCQPVSGNAVVAQTLYRNTSSGGQQPLTLHLFSASASLQAGKTVATVTLPTPSGGQLHVFAIGGGTGS